MDLHFVCCSHKTLLYNIRLIVCFVQYPAAVLFASDDVARNTVVDN